MSCPVVFADGSPHKTSIEHFLLSAVMAETLKPDLCIIGAGALGIDLAVQARARDLGVVLVQRADEAPGQTAQAALQHAALCASANRAQAIRTAEALGLNKADPKFNFRVISERALAIAHAAAPRTSPERLAALGITLMAEPAAFTDRRTLKVGETLIRAGQFVLATGSRPRAPDLPGLDQVSYFTPDSILDNARKLTHLVVIGGEPTALELAQAYMRLGAAVSVVPHGPLLAGFDPELVTVLLRTLREEGVDILEGASVTAIVPRGQGTGIAITHADGSQASLDVSHILVASGRVPDLDPALLDAARLKRDRLHPDHLLVSPQGQTSNGHISAIGGAAGVFDAPAALHQLAVVLQRASGRAAARINPARIPRLINTIPALAQIGSIPVNESLQAGQLVLRASASETDAARATGNLQGSAKLVVAHDGAIMGGAMLGSGAHDMVAMLALALDRSMGAADLAGLVLSPASPAAPLVEAGRQFVAQNRPSSWSRRRTALRRLLP